jgi:hypothetical protein
LADPPTRTRKARFAAPGQPGETARNSERAKAVVTRF